MLTYLYANCFPVHDVANLDDANQQHYDDDERLQQLQLLLLMTNPLDPCMHFHFPNVIQALRVSYSPIVNPKMIDCYGMHVAIVVVVRTFAFVLVVNVHVLDVDCDEAPENREISLAD